MNLSLCCISKTLSDNGQNFRTMTFAQFSKLPREVAMRELSARILHNFKMTFATIRFCQLNNIQGYRISSSLAPLLTHKNLRMRITDLPNYSSIVSVCEDIKKALAASPLRVSAHPSEYITFTSENQECVDNSILDLEQHAEIFDLLSLPQDYRSPLNIHVRKESANPQALADNVLRVYDKLPDNIRQRLVFENNDNAGGTWGIKNLIKHFFKSRGIPITYDSLHHSILHDDMTAEEAFHAAYETWPVTPLFHYSEGVNGTRKHTDMPTNIPKTYGRNVMYDIEMKAKNLAISKIHELAKQN